MQKYKSINAIHSFFTGGSLNLFIDTVHARLNLNYPFT